MCYSCSFDPKKYPITIVRSCCKHTYYVDTAEF